MTQHADWLPEDYPQVFHHIVRLGGGWIERGAVRWSPASARTRFRYFVRALRDRPGHPLHEPATAYQWTIRWPDGPRGPMRVLGVPRSVAPDVGGPTTPQQNPY